MNCNKEKYRIAMKINKMVKQLSCLGISIVPFIQCHGQNNPVSQPNIIYIFPDQMRNCAMEFWHNEHFSKFIILQPIRLKRRI